MAVVPPVAIENALWQLSRIAIASHLPKEKAAFPGGKTA